MLLLVLVLALVLVLVQVLVLVMVRLVQVQALVLVAAAPQSEELGSRTPSLEQQHTFPTERQQKVVLAGSLSKDTVAEGRNLKHMQVACNQALVCISMNTQGLCIDLRNLLHTYCSSWVDRIELYSLGSLHLHTSLDTLQRSVVHHKPTNNSQPCHKLFHTVGGRRQVDILDHTLLNNPNGILGDNQKMSCRQRQDRLQKGLRVERERLLGDGYLKKQDAWSSCLELQQVASSRCGISLQIHRSRRALLGQVSTNKWR